MAKGNSVPGNDPVAEAVGTTGLFLIVTAVIAFAVCLGGFGLAQTGTATTTGLIGLLSFGGSVACFLAESRPLPERERLVISARAPVASSSETGRRTAA